MVVVKEVAGAEAIAARAQPPGKGGNIASLKNCEIQFVWDGNLLRTFWELWSFATKNVGLEHRAQKYYPKHVYRRKKIPGQKGGAGAPWAEHKSALDSGSWFAFNTSTKC